MGLLLFGVPQECADGVKTDAESSALDASKRPGVAVSTCVDRPCCTHAACEALRQQAWCRQWVYMEWVSPTFLHHQTLRDRLTQRLGVVPFSFWGAWYRNYGGRFVYRLFVRARVASGFLHRDVAALAQVAMDAPDNVLLHVTRLRCCGLYHQDTLAGYWRAVMERERVRIGDDSVYSALRSQLARR